MLEVRLLGQFDLRRDGQTLALPSRAAQSLLAYLVLYPGLTHRREQLAGLLAPNVEEAAARNTLRHALWRVRKSLGCDPHTGRDYLIADEIAVSFDATNPLWLDAAVLAARTPADAGAEVLLEQVSVYGGELLPGFYDDWIVLERERVEAVFESKMRMLLERLSGAGCWDEVMDWGERWIAIGRSPESAYCALMLAHAARGDSSRIEWVYRRCAEDLQNGLGVQPSEATRRLRERLIRGDGVPVFTQAQVLAMPLRPGTQGESVPSPGAPPYKGLQPFESADAPLFFGREALTDLLVDHLRRHEVLVVVGASGSGKSSLLRAGLAPALSAGRTLAGNGRALQNTAEWEQKIITPTGRPLASLAAAMTEGDSLAAAARLADDLAADPRCLGLLMARRATTGGGQGRRLLLIVDQFEEVFTLCPREEERTAFVESLMSAVSVERGGCGGPLTLALALRADFYGQCARYPSLRRALECCQQYIGAMDEAELRRCIQSPLAVGGWHMEPGLVDLIVQDAGAEPGALPLLSHALLETWRRRAGRTLTLEGYRATGGVQGAIAATAEAVFAQFDAEEQGVARRIFLRLTALGDGMRETRRRVPTGELLPEAETTARPLVESVLDTLAASRLVTLGVDTVEVAHEALIREWPRLRGWLAEDREGLRLHRRLGEAAVSWDGMRDTADLYRGARLGQTVEWASRHPGDLSLLEAAFLTASQAEASRAEAEREAQQRRELEAAQRVAATEKARADEQRASNRAFRRGAVWLTAALVFALAMTALAMVMWREARASALAAQRERAVALSRELAASSEAAGDIDAERSILLAIEAVEAARSAGVAAPPEAEAALHHAAQSSRLDARFAGQGTVGMSPDGALAAIQVGDALRVVEPRRAAGGEPEDGAARYTVSDAGGPFAFSRDGRFLAVTGAVAGLRVLDAESGAAVQKWPDVWPLLALRLSADGARVVGESADGSTRTWEVATGDELASFRRAGVVPRHIDISPDGSRVLAGSFDGGVQLWDPATGARLLYVIGHNGYPWAARFCGRADRFVIGSGRGVRLWDAGTGLDLVTVNVPDAGPLAVACSPDGLTLATAAGDGMARVWNLEAKEGAAFFVGADVRDVEFTSDAAALITRHADGAARVWDLAGQRELIALGSARGSSDVAFSPAGTRLVAPAGDTGTIAIWDVPPGSGGAPSPGREAGGWRRYDLAAHANFVSRIAFAPTGRFAAASHDQTVSVWDVRADRLAPVRVAELPPGRAPVLDLAFSGDGARLATVTEVAVAQWEPAYSPASQTVLLAASDLPAEVSPGVVAQSPSVGQVAVGLSDGTVRVLAGDGAHLLTLTGHAGAVLDVAYSPDGRLLASAGADGTARIWNPVPAPEQDEPAAREALDVLRGHASGVNAVAFSPDGATLATGGQDGSLALWEVATGRRLFTLAALPAPVTGIAFSPDGRYLATSGDAVRVFLLDLDDLLALARQRVSRQLTPDECRKYLHQEAGSCD